MLKLSIFSITKSGHLKRVLSIFIIIAIILTFTVGCKKTGDVVSSKNISSGNSKSTSSTDVTSNSNLSSSNLVSNVSNIKSSLSSARVSSSNKQATSSSKTNNSSTTVSSVSNNVVSTAASFQPLGNGIMPIGAWIAPPQAGVWKNNPNYSTTNNFQIAKDSGINIIYGLYEKGEININNVINSLNCADAVGIKYLVSDSNIFSGADDKASMDVILNEYKSHPSFIGNLMNDEPAIPGFQILGDTFPNYHKSLPDKIFYTNLQPMYATVDQMYTDKTHETGGKATIAQYQNYLDKYIATTKPQFLSYDFYPCMGNFPSLDNNYYTNLSIIRSTSIKAGIPFWVFIQLSSWGSVVRVPTQSEVFWQVNTALAYGAQGIQYFTYWIPLESGWSGGMIDANGNKTNQYDYVKNANVQIREVQNVLMNSKSEGVIVSGNSPVTVPSSDILTNYKQLQSVTGGPAIIGCFNHQGKAAYYVVNNTINQSINTNLNFNGNQNLSIYSDKNNTNQTTSNLVLSLGAGEAALVTIN
jgi:hypothetical protein